MHCRVKQCEIPILIFLIHISAYDECACCHALCSEITQASRTFELLDESIKRNTMRKNGSPSPKIHDPSTDPAYDLAGARRIVVTFRKLINAAVFQEVLQFICGCRSKVFV